MISGHACTSRWYYNYWSFYWGGFWLRPGAPVDAVACGEWRSVIGFSFISFILWLLSSCLVRLVITPMLVKGPLTMFRACTQLSSTEMRAKARTATV